MQMLLQSDWLSYHTVPIPISKHPVRKCTPKGLRTSMKPRLNDRNISTQHIATLLGQDIARVCPPCCGEILGTENRTSAHARAQHCCTNLTKPIKHHATFTNVA